MIVRLVKDGAVHTSEEEGEGEGEGRGRGRGRGTGRGGDLEGKEIIDDRHYLKRLPIDESTSA